MAMIIVHTNESEEQTEADLPELRRQHADALDRHPTWAMFGGVITIEGRQYQVADLPEKKGGCGGNQKHVNTRRH